jgi:hypothetical protein
VEDSESRPPLRHPQIAGRPSSCRIGPDGFYGSGWDWDHPVVRARVARRRWGAAVDRDGTHPPEPTTPVEHAVDTERTGALLDERVSGADRGDAPLEIGGRR